MCQMSNSCGKVFDPVRERQTNPDSTITVADLFEAEGIRSDDDIEIQSETFDWGSYVTVL